VGATRLHADTRPRRRSLRRRGEPLLGRLLLLAALLLAATPARAGWFELSLNQDAVLIEGGRHHGADPDGRFAMGLRGLYDGDDARDAKLGGVVLRLEAEATRVPGLAFGVGLDAIAGTGVDRDLAAAPLVAEATVAPERWGGFFAGVRVGYAPSLLSFRDAERLLEWAFRAGYRVTPRIELFGEVRRIEIDVRDLGSQELAGTASLGFGGRF
jgi:hypothetical protein